MKDFKERLYEASMYAYGKILAKYNAFAQKKIVIEIGKDVLEYLQKHGFEFQESGSIEDIQAVIDLFVHSGLAEKLDVEPAEKGQRFTWHNIYGFDAYKELQKIAENTFLSCPVNTVLSYLADKHDKEIWLLEKHFDEERPVMISCVVIEDKENGSLLRDGGFDPAVLENARLFALAEERANKLGKMLSEIKTLRGLLPICAHCKKIRDDQGYWKRLESYLEEHTEAKFSHGLCPDCMKELYPELAESSEHPASE